MTRIATWVLGGFAVVFLLFLHLPMLMIVIFSFNNSNVIAFPLSGFTTTWYEELPQKTQMFSALWATIRLGVPVAVASTLIGFLAALGLTRHRVPARGLVSAVLMLPLAVPTFILGVALLSLVRQSFDWQPSLLVLGLAHTAIALPYSIFTLGARLEGLDPSYEEASRDLGQSPLATFWGVTVPLAMPAIISSLMLSFIISFDEYMLAFFLAGTTATLPIYMMGEMRFSYSLPSLLALGALIFVLSAMAVILAGALGRRNTTAHNGGQS